MTKMDMLIPPVHTLIIVAKLVLLKARGTKLSMHETLGMRLDETISRKQMEP